MRIPGQRRPLSAADAETRLRYVQDVRMRTRDAAVLPALLVAMLGGLIIVRGLLMLYFPHTAGIPAAWFLGASAALLVAWYWHARRQLMRRGVMPARSAPVVLAIVVAVGFIAHAVGANVVIAGLTVALSIASWRTGMRTVAIAIAAIGVISDGLVIQGARQWAALVIFGAGLIAVGIVQRQRLEHRS